MTRSIFPWVNLSIICIFLFYSGAGYGSSWDRLRRRIWKADDGETMGGVNSLPGALFGLLAFMLAFTFNQAGARFENVRVMIVDEANALRNFIYRAEHITIMHQINLADEDIDVRRLWRIKPMVNWYFTQNFRL